MLMLRYIVDDDEKTDNYNRDVGNGKIMQPGRNHINSPFTGSAI
jgi:hypothetical protein